MLVCSAVEAAARVGCRAMRWWGRRRPRPGAVVAAERWYGGRCVRARAAHLRHVLCHLCCFSGAGLADDHEDLILGDGLDELVLCAAAGGERHAGESGRRVVLQRWRAVGQWRALARRARE
eukprot:4201262-Prymnesium_polylepis.1